MEDKGELTTKALLLLETYLRCGCDKAKTAKVLDRDYFSVYQQLHQPYVRNIFKKVCIEKGITFNKLAETLSDGLNATRTFTKTSVDSKGNLVEKEIEKPDRSMRFKYLNTALEVFDVLKYNVKVESTGPQFHFYNIKQIIEDANRHSDERTDSIQGSSLGGSEELGKRTT